VWVTIRTKTDSATPCYNGLFKVVEIANAREASSEAKSEVVETRRLVWVTIRSKFDGTMFYCNGFFKVFELANTLEVAEIAGTELAELCCFDWASSRSNFSGVGACSDDILKLGALTSSTLEASATELNDLQADFAENPQIFFCKAIGRGVGYRSYNFDGILVVPDVERVRSSGCTNS
jgi:hypothetical protein